MQTIQPMFSKAGRVAAITLFAATAGLCAWAQQPAPAVSNVSQTQQPVLDLQAALKAPLSFFDADSSSSSSSSISSSSAVDAVPADPFLRSDSEQPPPRRRYGRPRYTDSSHNADGSNKYAFLAGGGFTLPTGGSHNYLKTNFNFQVGGGRNFNKNVSLIAQFDYANFGIQTNTLNNLLATYVRLGAVGQDGVTPLSQLGGGSHIWSFTLNPVYNFSGGDNSGAYVVGGVGFYHKVTTFTTPAIGTYCDYYYGCYQYQANQPIDDYTSNAIGVNGGIGFTYKLSRFANQRLYAEARYVYTANKRRPYFDGGPNQTSLSPTYFNVFPQNSAPTTWIPITVGIRF